MFRVIFNENALSEPQDYLLILITEVAIFIIFIFLPPIVNVLCNVARRKQEGRGRGGTAEVDATQGTNRMSSLILTI